MVVEDDYDEGPIRDDGDDVSAQLDAATGEEGAPCSEIAAELEAAAEAETAAPAAKGTSCVVCEKKVLQRWLACTCGARAHVACLAQHYIQVRPRA